MEANIKINTIMRVLGGLVSSLFLVMIIFSFFSNRQIPMDAVISGTIFVLTVAPVCIYGYISGEILDKLPTFLVNAIKGKYSKG